MHASTLARVYGCHGPSLGYFTTLVSQSYDVELSRLEVDQTLLVPCLLNIAGHRRLVRSVSLLLHFARFSECLALWITWCKYRVSGV